MPLLNQWLSHIHSSSADFPLEGTQSFDSHGPPKVGTAGALWRLNVAGPSANDPLVLLRRAAGRRHLGSFLEESRSSINSGVESLTMWPPSHTSSSSRGVGNSFLDVTLSAKQSPNKMGIPMPESGEVIGRVRLNRANRRANFTAFGEDKASDAKDTKPENAAAPDDAAKKEGKEGKKEEKKKPDPLEAMGMVWLFFYRAFLWTGLGVSSAGALMLDSKIEGLSKSHIDSDRVVNSDRAFSASANTPDDQPSRTVVELTGLDEDGVRLIGDKVVRYENYMMLRPLRRVKHTILDEKAVWQAQCQAMIWFFGWAILTLESVHLLRWPLLPMFSDYLVMDGGAKRLNDFVKAITGFCSFFLGLFTSLTLGRWQRLWEEFLKIFRGSEKLCTMLSMDLPERMMETDDPTQPPREILRDDVVACFQRWSQASVIILFEKYGKNNTNEDTLRIVQGKGLLNEEEVAILQQIPGNLAVALWAWNFKILHKVTSNKLAAIPMQPYTQQHTEAMFGCVSVSELLRQPLPFSYISLISMFVKFLNISVASSGGALFIRAIMHDSTTEAVFDIAFAALIPLVTNSVVILNLFLANPLRDHFTSMCPDDIAFRLEEGCKTSAGGAVYLPRFLANKWEEKSVS